MPANSLLQVTVELQIVSLSFSCNFHPANDTQPQSKDAIARAHPAASMPAFTVHMIPLVIFHQMLNLSDPKLLTPLDSLCLEPLDPMVLLYLAPSMEASEALTATLRLLYLKMPDQQGRTLAASLGEIVQAMPALLTLKATDCGVVDPLVLLPSLVQAT
jgi:hypothetical protein